MAQDISPDAVQASPEAGNGAAPPGYAGHTPGKAIEIRNLIKQYKKVTAVNNISLDVYEGEIFGFLGPNGAGKTTTIKTLLGLIFPTAGEVLVLGKPAGDIDVKEQDLLSARIALLL